MTGPGRFRDLDGRDAYELLGVSPGATRREISRARRARQQEAHPDHGAVGDLSKLINTAADILLDDLLRREYDAWRQPATTPDPHASGPSAWDDVGDADPPPSGGADKPAPSAWDDVDEGFGAPAKGYTPPRSTPKTPRSPYRGTEPPPTPGPVPGPGPGMAPQYGSPNVMPHPGQSAPQYYHQPTGPQRGGAGKVALIFGLVFGGACMLMCLLNALLVNR